MSGLLEIANLELSYGKRVVLRSVTFNAKPGEFLALVRVNGAGKSTILDIIAGFRKPSCGSVVIAGRDQKAWSLRELAQRVSRLPQTVHSDLPYTTEQLVAMGRYPHTDRWFESDEDHLFIRQAMERTRCWDYRHRNFASLSGGERQRVLLGACLAQNASTLLLDEPSTFLDIEQQLHCFTLLREVAGAGKLCIAVTHDLNLALSHCTRLIILPHLVRSRISPDHRILLPSLFFFGGTLLAACDALGRIVLPPAEIPAGAVLALIGGPYLVWAIRQRTPSEGT